MAKRTRITIETDSLLVLRGRKSLWAWCPQCGAEAEMIPLNDVGLISNLPHGCAGMDGIAELAPHKGSRRHRSHLPELDVERVRITRHGEPNLG